MSKWWHYLAMLGVCPIWWSGRRQTAELAPGTHHMKMSSRHTFPSDIKIYLYISNEILIMRKYDLMTFSYIYALHWKYKPGAHGSSSESLVSHHLWSSFNLQNLVASSYFLLWCSIQWVKMLSLWSTWRSLLLILLAKRKRIKGINWKSAKMSSVF